MDMEPQYAGMEQGQLTSLSINQLRICDFEQSHISNLCITSEFARKAIAYGIIRVQLGTAHNRMCWSLERPTSIVEYNDQNHKHMSNAHLGGSPMFFNLGSDLVVRWTQ